MKKFKIPKAIGACADRSYTLRQERLAAQKKVDLLAAEESAVNEYIINTLPKSQASGVAGKLARVAVTTKEVPVVRDWPAFYKHILKTKQFDLMQRRVAESAVAERWEDGKSVPGVERFNVTKISLNKL